MALFDYVAEEIALDHAEGLLSRREALRKLVLMGFTAASAGTLLAAAAATTPAAATPAAATKSTAKKPVTRGGTTASPSPTAASGPVTTEVPGPTHMIRFPGPAGELMGSFASPPKAKGAVLIIHENRGLTDHFKALPARFASSGYTALAIDLASRVGGTDAVADQMPAPLTSIPTTDLVADLKAGLTELALRAPGHKLGVIGFCFGGGMTWSLLASGEPRIAAAAPFYGPTPDSPDFAGSKKAAVLGVYAELDTRVDAGRPAIEAALKKAGMTYQIRVFPGVDHAFFNDTGPRYNATQAAAAYKAVLAWYAKYLS